MTVPVILVIEDNATNMKLMRAYLSGERYRMIEATTAEAGIELACDDRPDLVFMDIQLPGMDGLEALPLLKSRLAPNAPPVVAVTAFAMEADRQRGRDAGFDGYLVKPVSLTTLRGEIQRLLGAPAQREERHA